MRFNKQRAVYRLGVLRTRPRNRRSLWSFEDSCANPSQSKSGRDFRFRATQSEMTAKRLASKIIEHKTGADYPPEVSGRPINRSARTVLDENHQGSQQHDEYRRQGAK